MGQRQVSQVRGRLKRDCTDMNEDMPEKMEPSNIMEYAAWELLPSNGELAKEVLWMIESV